MDKITTVITVWQDYLKNNKDWENGIKDITPKRTGCGLVYELTNPIDRPNESFAIADMRNLKYAEPHYHVETEIYFVLQGSGKIVVRDQVYDVERDSVVVIPPNESHFTIPHEKLVLAVVNTPPFAAEHYIVLNKSNGEHGFDKKQFEKLVRGE